MSIRYRKNIIGSIFKLYFQEVVDFVMQLYIIDGTSFNIYSVKVYMRYLKPLFYIVSSIC